MAFQLLLVSVIFIFFAFYSEIIQGQLVYVRNNQIRNIDNLYSKNNQFSVGISGTEKNIYRGLFSSSFLHKASKKTNEGLLPYPLSYRQGLLSTSLKEGDTQRYRYEAIYKPNKPTLGNQEHYGKQRGHSFATFWNYLPYDLPPSSEFQSLPETDAYEVWGEAEEDDFRYLFY